MENIIKIDRKGECTLKLLKKLDETESKTYKVIADPTIIKIDFDEDKNKSIVFNRRLAITVNKPFKKDLIPKSIDYIFGYGYTITFK